MTPKSKRNKLANKTTFLLKFFGTLSTKSGIVDNETSQLYLFLIAYLIGRTYPSFFGTPQACYDSYIKYCQKNNALSSQIIKSITVFHRERKSRQIGVEMGY
jgi:hypothetical protein